MCHWSSLVPLIEFLRKLVWSLFCPVWSWEHQGSHGSWPGKSLGRHWCLRCKKPGTHKKSRKTRDWWVIQWYMHYEYTKWCEYEQIWRSVNDVADRWCRSICSVKKLLVSFLQLLNIRIIYKKNPKNFRFQFLTSVTDLYP